MHNAALRRCRTATAAAIVATAALVTLPVPDAHASAPPSNDSIARAQAVETLPFAHTVDLARATMESDEPISPCDFVTNSVWYQVRLNEDAVVRVETAGSATDTVLAVWDDPSLGQPLVCNNNSGESLHAALQFAAAAGITYLVQLGVDAQQGAEPGPARLTVEAAARPTGKPHVSGVRQSRTFAGALLPPAAERRLPEHPYRRVPLY